MSEALAQAAAEADAVFAARGGDLASSIDSRVENLRVLIDQKGFNLVNALGERGEDVFNQIAGVGARAVQSIDQQVVGLTALLTRGADELIAAVNGSAAEADATFAARGTRPGLLDRFASRRSARPDRSKGLQPGHRAGRSRRRRFQPDRWSSGPRGSIHRPADGGRDRSLDASHRRVDRRSQRRRSGSGRDLRGARTRPGLFESIRESKICVS